MQENEAVLAALHANPYFSDRVLRKVIEEGAYRTFDDWQARDLLRFGIPRDVLSQAWVTSRQIRPVDWIAKLKSANADLLPITSRDYPVQLRETAYPPALLYVRGRVDHLACAALAIIGTRKSTPYGIRMTRDIVNALHGTHILIVSGLAYGIDVTAHEAALDAAVPTVAVIGTGIDEIYPREHRPIAERIVRDGGTILSEFPLGTPPLRGNFPRRNRIIAGLARAIWLVEAPDKSGAHITMKFGLDENRDLYALPGDATRENSQGPLSWIRLGAMPAWRTTDFRDSFPGLNPTAPHGDNPSYFADPNETKIIGTLRSHSALHIDEIVDACRLDASVIVASLAFLEIRGLVRHLGGHRYEAA